MTAQYDVQISTTLLLLAQITYEQRAQNQPDVFKLKFKPSILQPKQEAVLKGYKQVGSFSAPELNFDQGRQAMQEARRRGFVLDRLDYLEDDIHKVEDTVEDLFPQRTIQLTGYALEPVDQFAQLQANIIALRGTITAYEWIVDIDFIQEPYLPNNPAYGEVHSGFFGFYHLMHSQVLKAARSFTNKNLPTYVTGHSLGSAIATLAALNVKMDAQSPDDVCMYNYASPRVGDDTFVKAYNQQVPDSFRVVNTYDIVPKLPPEWAGFGNVGQGMCFSLNAGSVIEDHSIPKSYYLGVTNKMATPSDC